MIVSLYSTIPQSLYIDYRKAFDVIDHNILLNKLQYCYKIGNTPLERSSSNFINRKQQIVSSNVGAELNNVEMGVPRGSVLGLTLLIVV